MEEKTIQTKPTTTSIETTNTYQHDIFTILEHEGVFMIAIGMSIVSREKFANLTEAKKYINRKPWELIINTTALVANKVKQLNID